MDLISETEAIKLLEEIKKGYNTSTEGGRLLRRGIQESIDEIKNKYGLYTLEHLGQADLKEIISDANSEIEKLSAEPETEVFAIDGRYSRRYTLCHEKAKLILQEEFNHIIDDVETDYADGSIGIDMKTIKQSDLKDYKIELPLETK